MQRMVRCVRMFGAHTASHRILPRGPSAALSNSNVMSMDPKTGAALYNAIDEIGVAAVTSFAEQLDVATELSFWSTLFLLLGTATALSLPLTTSCSWTT